MKTTFSDVSKLALVLLLAGAAMQSILWADTLLEERNQSSQLCMEVDKELTQGVRLNQITQDEADNLSDRCWTLYGDNA